MPYLLLTVSALIWSGNFVLARAVSTTIPPAGLLFWRWLLALVVLLPIVLPRLPRQWPIIRANLLLFPVFGLLGVTLFNLLIYTAMHTTTAINAALVNSVIPVLIIFFARAIYGQSVSGRQWGGILLSLLGVVVIILRGDPAAIATLSFNTGDLLVLAAAFVWALYSVLLRLYPKELDSFVFLFVIALCGEILLLPLYLHEHAAGHPVHLTPANLAVIAYVGVLASVAAFAAWNSGIRRIGAHTGGQFIHLMPAFSTILATIFLKEQLQLFHMAGIALIIAGILCATLRPLTRN